MSKVALGVGDVVVTRVGIELRNPLDGEVVKVHPGTSLIITETYGKAELFDVAWATEASMIEVPQLPADALMASAAVKVWDAARGLHFADLPEVKA